MYEMHTVSLSLIDPNPHRDLITYPWIEAKIEQLKRSISDVGFWAGVIGRRNGKRYEIAFGHHRLEAARRLGIEEVPLIVEALDDQQMLQFMGRENGEDYSSDFLVMLNTWDGAVKFFANKFETKVSKKAQPIDIASLLGWTVTDKRGGRHMGPVAAACAAGHALISGGYCGRSDLYGLTVSSARELLTRTQERIEQLARIGTREGRKAGDTKHAQAVIGKAAQITAREVREGSLAARNVRSQVDLNAMRAAGSEKSRLAPLFAVFGQGLCDSIARMLNSDSTAERISEIEKVMGSIELEEDHAILRKLHHEFDELGHRTQRAKKRTTPNKIVPLKAIEKGA